MWKNARCLTAFLRHHVNFPRTTPAYNAPVVRCIHSAGEEHVKISGVSGWGGLFGLTSLLYFSSDDKHGSEGATEPRSNTYSMLSLATKQRMFFNYEKRIRELSTTEKIFEYFSSVERDGMRYMSPADLLTSLVAVYPPEDSPSVERAGSLRGERNPNTAQRFNGESILKEIDCDGDGVISYPEYLLLLTLLSIPLQDVQTVMQVVDTDGNGEIDLQEFRVILEALQNNVKLNPGGSWHFRYMNTPGGMLHSFFGKDLNKRINTEFLLSFLQRLKQDIVMLEFEYYDWQNKGQLSALDFARSLVTAAGPKQVNALLDKVDSLPDELKQVTVSKEDWCAVAGIREHLHVLEVALHFFEQLKGQVTQSDLQHILHSVLKTTLRQEVMDIIGYAFRKGREADGPLDTDLILAVFARHCLTLQHRPQS